MYVFTCANSRARQCVVYTALVQYLSNTVIHYPKSITKPTTEILKQRNKITNIAIFSDWNILNTRNIMKNLHKLAESVAAEPNTG